MSEVSYRSCSFHGYLLLKRPHAILGGFEAGARTPVVCALHRRQRARSELVLSHSCDGWTPDKLDFGDRLDFHEESKKIGVSDIGER